jgi:aryl-alcohol dehydrogenase-like predicted oxidoreductase
LNTDYIDLYWLHAWDFTTYPEEVMRALDDMVRQGKVLYIGISDTPAWIVARANTLAELKSWTAFVGLQIEYSLVERTPERELLPMADAFGMSILAWSPLGAGILTGKYNDQSPSENTDTRLKPQSSHFNERNLQIAREVTAVAEEVDADPAQVAIAWLLHRRRTIPILGARRVEQLEQNMAATEVQLDEQQLARLDNISAVDLGFPHEFLARDNVRKMLLGEDKDQLAQATRG